MSELSVVTTISITAVSWSIWKPTFTVKRPDGDPGVEVLVDDRSAEHVEECADGEDERADHAGDGNVGRLLLQIFAEQSRDQEAGERQQRYQCVFEHIYLDDKSEILISKSKLIEIQTSKSRLHFV